MQTKGIILDSYKQIQEVFEQNGVQKPFVCCGKSFQQTEIFKYLKDNFNIVLFDHIRPNPRFDDMIDGVKLFREEGCDFIVGAGGGSPIDTAKMIKVMSTNEEALWLTENMKSNEYKSLFIPTTAGTGTEATWISVFYVNEVDKLSIHHSDFLPDYVILDDTLLETLPLYQKKCTCLDALCHSIESYWSTKATEESKEYSKKGILGFMQNMDGYISNTKDGNKGMLMASYYGGKAINIAGTVAPHAFCYNLTMNCGTSHGHSCAVGLSKIWEYMLSHDEVTNHKEGRAYTLQILDDVGVMLGGKDRFEGLDIFNSILTKLEIPFPTIEENRIAEFLLKVNTKKLLSNPVRLEADDVEAIYKMILGVE